MKGADLFRERYGPWAAVAGAGEGLGAAFADALAAHGVHVVLIDRRADLLAALAPRLERMHGVTVAPLVLDLAAADVVERVARTTDDKDVGLLVYNAAHSPVGEYLEQTAEAHRRTLAVNCHAPALLVHHLGPRLRARGRGGILLMSSLSAFQGHPLLAHYAASKAYNLVLAEGLWDEWRGYGIDVLACCPGATRTPGYLATRPATAGVWSPPEMEPDAVARAALAALGRGPAVIPGLATRVGAFLLHRVLPRARAVTLMGRISRRLLAATPPART